MKQEARSTGRSAVNGTEHDPVTVEGVRLDRVALRWWVPLFGPEAARGGFTTHKL